MAEIMLFLLGLDVLEGWGRVVLLLSYVFYCVGTCRHTHATHSAHVEVSGKLLGHSSLLSPSRG